MNSRLARRVVLSSFLSLLLSGVFVARSAEPSKITAALQPFVESSSLAGAVSLVANSNGILDGACVGWADIAAKKPLKPDSIFWIASMSKPITGAAVMMLVDEGKISLDDPVEKYLPEFKGQMAVETQTVDRVILKKPRHPITIREVMSHTSGLPFKSRIEEPTLDGLPLAEAVRSYAMTPLQWEPGTKYQYSNAGINTGARIIEVVTGMKYEDFMDARLFKPLGMKDTTFWPSEKQAKRIARSYKPDAAKTNLVAFNIVQLIYPLSDRERRFPMPAGGLFSTAADCAKFCQMVLRGGELGGKRYLSEEAVKVMTSKQTPAEVSNGYGCGWAVGPDFAGHGGAHATNMDVNWKQGLVFVWLVQHAGGFPGNGAQAQGVFKKLATEQYGVPK